MFYNEKYITNQPLNADFTSLPGLVAEGTVVCMQLAFTGSPCTFTTKLQGSNDAPGNDPTKPVNFDDVPNSTQSFTASGTFTYNLAVAMPTGFTWVRLVVSGTSMANPGSLSATLTVKGTM